MLTVLRRLTSGAVLAAGLIAAQVAAAQSSQLPPAAGPVEPRVPPIKGEDGIYAQEWFAHSLLNLKEEFDEARSKGKRLAVVFEQRGCVYCVKMHTDSLSQRYINDYVRANFHVVQLDLWGARPVTDLDGKEMQEKKIAERWGVMFTPTIIFYKDDLKGLEGKVGPEVEVARTNRIGAGELYDMFVWVRHKVYEVDRNFQRFHNERFREREALSAKEPGNSRTN